MALNANERQAIIGSLTTNCPQLDADYLGRMGDDKLTALKEHFDRQALAVNVANAAVRGIKDDESGLEMRINPETGKWEKRLAANAKKKMPPPEEEEEDDEEYEEDEEEVETNAAAVPPVRNARPRTPEEWYASAPENIRRTFEYAKDLENKAKDDIIGKLLVNVSDGERPRHWERLRQRTLRELEADLLMVPKTPTHEEVERLSTRPAVNRRRDDDVLALPGSSWAEVDGATQQATVMNQEPVESLVNVEDEIQQLSPHLRAIVQNAMQVESSKRQELIEEIIANVADESNERRWRHKLQDKALKDLKDIYEMLPKRSQKTADYFGSQGTAPLAANLRSGPAADPGEDVLPLPSYETYAPEDDGKRRKAT